MMLQLLIPALLAWAGWALFTPPTVEWVLSQTPFAVALAGWLVGNTLSIDQVVAWVRRQKRPVRQPEFLPAGVVVLDDKRRQRRHEQRRAA